MIIVYCLDENYRTMAARSIDTFRKYNPTAKFVVVSEKPMSMGAVECQNFVVDLSGYNFRFKDTNNDRITKAAYLKLFLTELPFEKIIYVDADTICQAPLNELWDMPCEYINICESHNYGKKQAQAIGVKKYALTGMMVMNLKALRSVDFKERCLSIQKVEKIPPEFWQHDETCINLGMQDKLNFIPKKWNYCANREYDDPIPEAQAKILHIVGRNKDRVLYGSNYESVDKIKEAIAGKRVAIVGNAKSIFDGSKGAEIDTFDFVIRFNRGFISKPESQGTKTNLLLLACNLTPDEVGSYNADFVCNRSSRYETPAYWEIHHNDRAKLNELLGSQPSTGFMAIDLCLAAGAQSIDLFGFDFEKTPTFYNPDGYQTAHDYPAEEQIVSEYQRCGLLKIHEPLEGGNEN